MLNYPRPPFPKQKQPMPGVTNAMTPVPDHGETSYKGETERLVTEAGRKAILVRGDLKQPDHCRAVIAKAVSELGGVDILVNNADKAYDHPQARTVDAVKCI